MNSPFPNPWQLQHEAVSMDFSVAGTRNALEILGAQLGMPPIGPKQRVADVYSETLLHIGQYKISGAWNLKAEEQLICYYRMMLLAMELETNAAGPVRKPPV